MTDQPIPTSSSLLHALRHLITEARQQVLRHWRFEPALRDGAAVPAIGLVPVQFSLPD